MKEFRRRRALAACTSLAVVALAGYGAIAAAANAKPGRPSGTARIASGGYHVVFMGWPTSSTPFFSAMQLGVAAAGRNLGINAQYIYPTTPNPDSAAFAQRLQSALAVRPSALVVADFFPSAVDSVIKAEAAKGVPVILVNSGENDVKATGALAYVGEDETATGVAAGKAMTAAGGKAGLFVNNCDANPSCVAFGKGIERGAKQGGGSVTELDLSNNVANNPTATEQAIYGSLVSHKRIDAIYGYAQDMAQIQQAVKQSGRAGIRIGLHDLAAVVLRAVRSGKVLFDIDQQPYLQGYYGVLAAYQAARYGMHPVGNVLTGPLLVTKRDAAQALAEAKGGNGIRGF